MTTSTTTVTTTRKHHPDAGMIGYTARRMRRHADNVLALADRIETWDFKARTALGLIDEANERCAEAHQFYTYQHLAGTSFASSLRNEGMLTLGLEPSASCARQYDVAKTLMYTLGEFEKEASGQYSEGGGLDLARSTLRCQASSLRTYASTVVVAAGVLEELAAGKLPYLR